MLLSPPLPTRGHPAHSEACRSGEGPRQPLPSLRSLPSASAVPTATVLSSRPQNSQPPVGPHTPAGASSVGIFSGWWGTDACPRPVLPEPPEPQVLVPVSAAWTPLLPLRPRPEATLGNAVPPAWVVLAMPEPLRKEELQEAGPPACPGVQLAHPSVRVPQEAEPCRCGPGGAG